MTTRLHSVVLAALLFAPAFAQEGFDMGPAAELQKLAPMIGNWAGNGNMMEPNGAKTAWRALGSYRWCLNKHFVQEDFRIEFDGSDVPLVFRAYIGWDREHSRYVSAVANNGGQVMLNEMTMLPDGTMLHFIMQQQAGAPYVERSATKVDGDSMSMTIDLLMPKGELLQTVLGKFKRVDEVFDGDYYAKAWMGAKPDEAMQKLASMAGSYNLKGEMTMVPGQPKLGITGTDKFSVIWGGNVIAGRTDGMAEGAPEKYVSVAFWAWREQENCMIAIFADNMGQIGEMQVRWCDGKIVSTMAGTQQGQPMTQRFVLELDASGAPKLGVGHSIIGTMPPFESFRATYSKRSL